MQARRTMEIDLRRALTIGEFEVYYQPLITLKTEKISGFEALLRWHHPERGMVPPLEFIPVAEEIGLIGQIGAWVLKQACLEAAKWPDDIHIAVNLSPAQFRDRAVVLDVVAALGVSGLPAHRLEIEITESVLLQDTQSNLAILGELRDLGVGISMDDFGTGYSSLAYLQKFSFHKIKIDRSFVSELERPESIVSEMTLRLILAGDVNLMNVADPKIPFRHVAAELHAADAVFGNLECCLHLPPQRSHAAEGFFADPEIGGEALRLSGIDAVGIANNVNYGAGNIAASIARLGSDRRGAYRRRA